MEIATKNDAEKFKPFTEEQVKAIPKWPLAKKYRCSAQYIRQILEGTRGKRKSYVTEKVREDAAKILTILEL